MSNKANIAILTLGIFAFAAFFRLYGVNWDQGQHLHPDERFLTMVTEALVWPKNIVEYLDTSASPLNPHNKGYGFLSMVRSPSFSRDLLLIS